MQKLKIALVRLYFNTIVAVSWWRKRVEVAQVTTKAITVDNGHIEARIYTPEGTGPFPVILYYHGGGFMMGSTAVYDPVCRDCCQRSQHIVVSINYRLAPKHPFPTAANDCIAAAKWLAKCCEEINGDVNRVIAYGDSAGGNMAAVTVQQTRETLPGFFKGQILIYPVLGDFNAGTASYVSCEKSKGLSSDLMRWFWRTYLKNSIIASEMPFHHDLATPVSVDNLNGLPPTFILTAGDDPLKDEGIEYHHRLSEQNIHTTHVHFSDCAHGFIGTTGPTIDHNKAMSDIIKWLNNLA